MKLWSIMFVDSCLYALNNYALYAKTEGLGHCLFLDLPKQKSFLFSHTAALSVNADTC